MSGDTTDDKRVTIAAAGDALATRRLRTHESDGFTELVEHVREADVSMVNLETLLHDFEGYPGPGALPMRSAPWVADELSWAGFELFSAATNHANDYWHGGMEATMAALEERDLVYAGLGRNLAAARAPGYLDTPVGRVGLVSATSTYQPGSVAAHQRRDMQGRPGVSPLRLDTRYTLPDAEFEALLSISEKLGLESIKQRQKDLGVFPDIEESEDTLAFLNVDPVGAPGSNAGSFLKVERGDQARIVRDVDDSDARAVLDQVKRADRQSEWVLASIHTHEGENGTSNQHSTPAFVETFARECVDAGADAVFAHGPHRIRGIEVYDGAPVFYSLGNFIKQNEFISRYSAEVYDIHGFDQDAGPEELYRGEIFTNFDAARADFESFLPLCRFADGDLTRIDLLPFDMGYGQSGLESGYPELVNGERAESILDQLAELSEPYGTEIAIEDGTGVVRME